MMYLKINTQALLDFIKRNYSENVWRNEFVSELLSSKLVSGFINDII